MYYLVVGEVLNLELVEIIVAGMYHAGLKIPKIMMNW